MSLRERNLGLRSVDELFMTGEEREDLKLERVKLLPLEELHPFENHPFRVRNDEEMEKMTESIRKVGVITPVVARPKTEGGYEIISGHRRFAACQMLGLPTVPVVVREMTDDEAVIAMVDANMQREKILPSEKAFAYRMKRDALEHQGKRSDLTSSQLGTKLRSDEIMAADSGESRNQIQRFIRLTYLIPEFLEKVDDGRIAFNPAVELSFLTEEQQHVLLDAMEESDCTPSHAQAIRLKKMSQEGSLDSDAIARIISETKPNQQEQYKFRRDDIRRYFPSSYTDEQVHETVIRLLEQWQKQRQRNNGAR